MAVAGKIRSLSVRPIQSADLAFAVPGVLGSENAPLTRLGTRLRAFDRDAELIAHLGEAVPVNNNDPLSGRLTHDSAKVSQRLAPAVLFRLRNEVLAADLDQGILQHHSLFLSRFRDGQAIVDAMRAEHQRRRDKLGEEYKQKGEDLVVHRSVTDTGYPIFDGAGQFKGLEETWARSVVRTDLVAMRTPAHTISVAGGGINPAPITHSVAETLVVPHLSEGNGTGGQLTNRLAYSEKQGPQDNLGFLSQLSFNEQKKLRSETDLIEKRMPFHEHRIEGNEQVLRALDEATAETVAAGQYKHLDQIWRNDSDGVALQVRKLQLAYAETFLVSPISGIVVGTFKDVGETVQAGEAVLRVENDDRLLLVGFVQCRFPVRVGMPVAIVAEDVFEGRDTMKVAGEVRAVRGHEADDDEWDLIIECDNTGGHEVESPGGVKRKEKLPLNYHFDRDTASISFG